MTPIVAFDCVMELATAVGTPGADRAREIANMRSIRQTLALTTGLMVVAVFAAGCGTLGVTCTSLTAVLCGDGFYCEYLDGTCGEDGEFGLCLPRPEACTLIFAPVCGCDGETYGNECEAAAAGVSVRREGACDTDDGQRICGGIAGLPCDEGEFCKYGDGTCGAADQSGVCMPTPEFCTEEYAPVCGCDERTYGNECEADRAGISVLRSGECDGGSDEQICGGIAGFPCDEGEYCQTNVGECCCDFLGVCTPIPEVCTQEYAPVCGCDARTYDNPCYAAAAGVSIDSDGPCPQP